MAKKTDQLQTKKRTFATGARQEMNLKFRSATMDEIRKGLGDTDISNLPAGYVAGWASTSVKDHASDVIVSGAFSESIRVKGLEGPRGIKFLSQHESDRPAGVIKVLEYRDGGLWIEAQLNLEISYVKDLYEASKMQGGLNFSVGYRLVEGGFEFVDKGEDSYWLITKADLHEVSVVTFPGNEEAEMLFIKGGPEDDPFETVAEFEKALVASGCAKSRNEAQRVTKWLKRLSKPAPKTPVSANVKSLDSIAASLKALRELS